MSTRIRQYSRTGHMRGRRATADLGVKGPTCSPEGSPSGEVRTHADMTKKELRAIEKQYGMKIVPRPPKTPEQIEAEKQLLEESIGRRLFRPRQPWEIE